MLRELAVVALVEFCRDAASMFYSWFLVVKPSRGRQEQRVSVGSHRPVFYLLRYVCKSGGLRAVLNAVKLWIFFQRVSDAAC